MDNLERAVAALGDQGEQIVAGLEMVRGQLAALLSGPRGRGDPRPRRGVRPDGARGDRLGAVRRPRRTGPSSRWSRRATATPSTSCVPRASSSPRARSAVGERTAARGRPLRHARRREDRERRRDQEGVPQAGPGAPPGRATRATRRPRSASRRSPTPTTCSSDPDKRARVRRAAAPSAAARPQRRRPAGAGGATAAGFGDFADMFSSIFRSGARRAARGRRASRRPAAAPTSRWRST